MNGAQLLFAHRGSSGAMTGPPADLDIEYRADIQASIGERTTSAWNRYVVSNLAQNACQVTWGSDHPDARALSMK
jgi:hypothetical protein